MSRNGQNTSKLTSQIRQRINHLNTEIGHLDGLLTKMAKNKSMHGITDKEISRRRDLLHNLNNQKESFISTLNKPVPVAGSSADRDTLFGGQGNQSSSSGRTWGSQPPKETARTQGLNNDQIVFMQQQMMEEQDQGVDALLATVQQQKHLGYAISDELDLQKGLLDDLDGEVDKTQGNLKRQGRRLNKLSKSSKQGMGIGCVIFLIILLVVGIFTDWGCKIFKSSDQCK
eukprot:GCRY01001238.1.p1 GENE.GCRY01001238.1~~GCRY01001238.1.p1  ORF type:complete len:229 (+),score=30.61 GCRY01001238.1:257-943(+)